MHFEAFNVIFLSMQMDNDRITFYLCRCGSVLKRKKGFRDHLKNKAPNAHTQTLCVLRCIWKRCPLSNVLYNNWEDMRATHAECIPFIMEGYENELQPAERTLDIIRTNPDSVVEGRLHGYQAATHHWVQPDLHRNPRRRHQPDDGHDEVPDAVRPDLRPDRPWSGAGAAPPPPPPSMDAPPQRLPVEGDFALAWMICRKSLLLLFQVLKPNFC